jgi:hypothetical protein
MWRRHTGELGLREGDPRAIMDKAVKLPDLSHCTLDKDDTLIKETKTDDGYKTGWWPAMTACRPKESRNLPLPHILHARAHGGMALVTGFGNGLLLKLNTASEYPSFLERQYLARTIRVRAAPGTVAADLKARSFWPSLEDNMSAPRIGEGIDADFAEFVAAGKPVEGVAARVLALALEHALVPFRNRTRVKKAAACYYCSAPDLTFSMKNVQAAMRWTSPGKLGRDVDPRAVVYVGDAKKVKGMSLLSRVYDAGGPLYQERAYILDQFDEGSLLMFGTGGLTRELRPIEANDLWLAIEEALWILVELNHLPVIQLDHILRLLIRNLPIADIAAYRQRGVVGWQTQAATFGPPVLSVPELARVAGECSAAFGNDSHAALGLLEEDMPTLCSDLFRDVVLQMQYTAHSHSRLRVPDGTEP